MLRTIRPLLSLSALLGASLFGSAASADDSSAGTSTNVPTPMPASVTSVSEAADPNEPQSETEITRTRFPNRPLLATGAVLLVGGYVPAAIGGALSSREEDEKLYIPVAGPWMTLTSGERESGGEKTLLVVDGAVQGVGALGMLLGLMIPETTTKNWYLIGSNERFRLAPQGIGLGASGRF